MVLRLIAVLAFLSGAASPSHAQSPPEMTDEEKKAREDIIGIEDPLDRPLGKLHENGKGGFDQVDPDFEPDAEIDPNKIQIHRGDPIQGGVTIDKAQRYQSKMHGATEFDRQHSKYAGKVPPDQLVLYFIYMPSPHPLRHYTPSTPQ